MMNETNESPRTEPPGELDNVPKFGELQAKIDAHPLFSGVSSPPPKRPHKLSRFLWPVAALILVGSLTYLAIDAGIVKGASHLPFHLFKQPVSASAPVIASTQPAASSSKQTTADPYAGWKAYTSSVEGLSFKYPSDWSLTNTLDPRDTLVKESVSLAGPNYFSLGFDVYKVNANSYSNCTNCTFNGVSALNTANYGKQLYTVTESNTVNGQPYQTLSISEYKDRQQQPIQSWPYYTSKTQSGYVVRWSGDYAKSSAAGAELIYSTYSDFSSKPEVIKAKLILQSLSY